jgi:uncharacterized protein
MAYEKSAVEVKAAAEGTIETASDAHLEQLVIWLRQDLVGELEAINQYQAHINAMDHPEIRSLLEHIRDDEKEHVAELTHLLTRVDAMQLQKFANDHTAAAGERVVAAPEETTNLTVGNMFGQK